MNKLTHPNKILHPLVRLHHGSSQLYLHTSIGDPSHWSYQTPSLDIFKKLERVIFGSSTAAIFFFFIFVIFNEPPSFDSVSVTEAKL